MEGKRPSSDLGTANGSDSACVPSAAPLSSVEGGESERAKKPRVVSDVDWSEQNRQWDARINLSDESCNLIFAEHELEVVCKRLKEWPAVKYCFVGGIELGENPATTDYQKLHAHIALILHNPTTRRSIVHNLAFGTFLSGNLRGKPRSYYLQARNPFASFKGWLAHHSKEATKVGASYVALDYGTPPKQYANQLIEPGKPEKMKQDDMLREVSYAYIVVVVVYSLPFYRPF